MNAITSNDDILFYWSIASAEFGQEEEPILFQEITKLWITVRGFAYVSGWVEQYKQLKSSTLQKKRHYVKHLKLEIVHENRCMYVFCTRSHYVLVCMHVYYNMFKPWHQIVCRFCRFFLHFCIGPVLSTVVVIVRLRPRQLPLTASSCKEATTLSACVFLQNSATVGLSLVPPLCRWHPKNFSRGSWFIFSLRNDVTPGRVKMYVTKPMKDALIRKKKNILLS